MGVWSWLALTGFDLVFVAFWLIVLAWFIIAIVKDKIQGPKRTVRREDCKYPNPKSSTSTQQGAGENSASTKQGETKRGKKEDMH